MSLTKIILGTALSLGLSSTPLYGSPCKVNEWGLACQKKESNRSIIYLKMVGEPEMCFTHLSETLELGQSSSVNYFDRECDGRVDTVTVLTKTYWEQETETIQRSDLPSGSFIEIDEAHRLLKNIAQEPYSEREL